MLKQDDWLQTCQDLHFKDTSQQWVLFWSTAFLLLCCKCKWVKTEIISPEFYNLTAFLPSFLPSRPKLPPLSIPFSPTHSLLFNLQPFVPELQYERQKDRVCVHGSVTSFTRSILAFSVLPYASPTHMQQENLVTLPTMLPASQSKHLGFIWDG